MAAVEARTEAPSPKEGVNVANASVAVVALEGAPSDVEQGFVSNLKTAAAEHEVAFTEAASARYFLHIYFSAESVESKAEYAYVIEIFGRDKKRVRRLDEAIVIDASADDLWGVGADGALKKLSASAADSLYAFLTNTPEATPLAGPRPALVSLK
jgi:hypothetical protein